MKTAEMPTADRIWFEAKTEREKEFINKLQTHLAQGGSLMMVMTRNGKSVDGIEFTTK